MKNVTKQDITLFAILLTAWLMLMLAPAGICFLIDPTGQRHWAFLTQGAMMIGPMAIVFMVSFYSLVPYLFYRGHRRWYLIATLLLILLLNIRWLSADVSMLDDVAQTGFYVWLFSSFAIQIVAALSAFGVRGYLQSHHIKRQLEEERRKSTEAELTWLKNQLNPHFLFNSLNNISSLTQIDPDEAQEAIAQLSDLLRYALYESNKQLVPLTSEIEFMHNYISMMRLRCSSMTTVTESFPETTAVPNHNEAVSISVAPLLFISFIENAFKHGTSNNQPSLIDISLKNVGNNIIFSCRNTSFPKSESDHSGSGVGLENTRRRLDLLYQGRYTWEQSNENGFFCIKIAIKA